MEQTDIHVPFATVHEALQLSARLRLPSHIGCQANTTEAFVHEVRQGGHGKGPAGCHAVGARWAPRLGHLFFNFNHPIHP